MFTNEAKLCLEVHSIHGRLGFSRPKSNFTENTSRNGCSLIIYQQWDYQLLDQVNKALPMSAIQKNHGSTCILCNSQCFHNLYFNPCLIVCNSPVNIIHSSEPVNTSPVKQLYPINYLCTCISNSNFWFSKTNGLDRRIHQIWYVVWIFSRKTQASLVQLYDTSVHVSTGWRWLTGRN